MFLCNYHGNCINTDKCICEIGWYGEKSEITECFGILANETNICSGHGICINLDEYKCEAGWRGDDRSEQIFECYGKKDDDSFLSVGGGK